MMFSNFSKLLLIAAFIGGIVTILFTLISYRWNGTIPSVQKHPKCLNKEEKLFTANQLAQYIKLPTVLLGFLGVVYNVSSGHYYHSGGAYEFFAGKDATRAFLTGEFKSSDFVDDITDLEESYLQGIQTWVDLYEEKYPRVGLVIGSYYDDDACPTEKLFQLQTKLQRISANKKSEEDELHLYPPCNSQWDASTKRGKVWCSNLSGGISRSWTGKPRQIYDLGSKKWRCACLKNDEQIENCDRNSTQAEIIYDEDESLNQSSKFKCRFKYYDDCDLNTEECNIY